MDENISHKKRITNYELKSIETTEVLRYKHGKNCRVLLYVLNRLLLLGIIVFADFAGIRQFVVSLPHATGNIFVSATF